MNIRIARRVCALLALAAGLVFAPAHGQLSIEITTEGGRAYPIAIVPFADEAGLPLSVSKVVSDDLGRSGQFKLVDPTVAGPLSPESGSIDYVDWKNRGADAVVVGSAQKTADGRYQIRFKLLDVLRQNAQVTLSFSATAPELRMTAHRIADVIYENITGDRGVFSTKIAYVVKNPGKFQLKIADWDGDNEQTAASSAEPMISPSWSPDGRRLAYVSFEPKKPVVVVQTLATGKRVVVANFRGTNSSPAWSPDGRKLAVTLTKDGGSHLYLMDLERGSQPVRLTTDSTIDTEPSFSPDGKWIAFTSDRSGVGKPQIFRIPADGGEPERLTFTGSFNTTPRYSYDGRKIVYVERSGSTFRVQLLDVDSKQTQSLTDGPHDGSPSFAPNDRAILYATQAKGRGVLATVSTDGRVRRNLTTQSGDISEPAWGPL
jgi:TolB protein